MKMHLDLTSGGCGKSENTTTLMHRVTCALCVKMRQAQVAREQREPRATRVRSKASPQ
jgi:hypothetical protein